MLFGNIKPSSGLINGSSYVIDNMIPNVHFLTVVSGLKTGERLILVRMNCTVSKDDFLSQDLEDVNFPYGFVFP